ncbi:hypothetical protein ASD60_01670 [Pseudomonas sp. Root562]|nr:hypothetical protein ASD60_01670 [Pseudomonas sp. Root562]
MEGTRFEFAERAGALALFTVACGKVASLRHRLTREMKAKCYKNVSAGAKISAIKAKSNVLGAENAAFVGSCRGYSIPTRGLSKAAIFYF